MNRDTTYDHPDLPPTVLFASRAPIESLNFPYSLQDFTSDWRGVRKYDGTKSASNRTVVRMPGGESRRPVAPGENSTPQGVSQWFLDRYGDDPDHLYARYMRFTMLADVLSDYAQEIRQAGLELKNGYCEELLPVLLRLEVQEDRRGIAGFDRTDILTAIRKAARLANST